MYFNETSHVGYSAFASLFKTSKVLNLLIRKEFETLSEVDLFVDVHDCHLKACFHSIFIDARERVVQLYFDQSIVLCFQ